MTKRKIGFALGGGAARGWAHIGIIKTLQQYGIVPDLICGTSIGALVGAAYATNKMEALEEWILTLRRRDIAGFLDFTFGGGMIEGERIMKFFLDQLGADPDIEKLTTPYGAVATALETGNEIWLQSGSLEKAVRASIALPGLFTPIYHNEQWLVDGGLVNPVPVSLCRAMGADVVVAVSLNANMVGRSMRKALPADDQSPAGSSGSGSKNRIRGLLEKFSSVSKEQNGVEIPGLFEVISNSVTIMQDRLTRSRMAGDPPELLLSPDVSDISLMDFDRGDLAIERGVQCVERNAAALETLLSC
ncbi:MAG: patatin-like phospholipase RssA [Gammaproteobacteria bacterium]|nr:patatin-like phospholipase RssA [Gammaproteobacteria bacterium]MDH5652735.1 patatin-like phospholipase RssA [Gammaproteobacteria bacterium]